MLPKFVVCLDALILTHRYLWPIVIFTRFFFELLVEHNNDFAVNLDQIIKGRQWNLAWPLLMISGAWQFFFGPDASSFLTRKKPKNAGML